MKRLTAYRTTNFQIEELVPQYLYLRFRNNQDFLWSLFDPYALWTLDAITDHYDDVNKLACNDWVWGGPVQGRGFRPADHWSGADISPHQRGCGFDLFPSEDDGVTGVSIRDDIMASPQLEPFQFITCVWARAGHVHFDLRNHDRDRQGILVKGQ